VNLRWRQARVTAVGARARAHARREVVRVEEEGLRLEVEGQPQLCHFGTKGVRKKVLALLTTAVLTTESAFVAPDATVWGNSGMWGNSGVPSRRCGVPNLPTAVFENVGGVVFVPVRYASPHVPELGLPRGSVASWFGETGIQTERGVREAALSVAWN
jgi:hypothetical protein